MPLISEYEVEVVLKFRMTSGTHLQAMESAVIRLQEIKQNDVVSIDVKKV